MKPSLLNILRLVLLAVGLSTLSFSQTRSQAPTEQPADQAMSAMAGHHMDMGSHMQMTPHREPQPGDQEKAQAVLEAARKVCDKYKDYQVALAAGFHIFMPDIPHHQYHFNNAEYAREAVDHFNPEHPTSLLYEKSGDSYRLVGVMYTAPKWSTTDDLNQRIPLSISQWHAHVNMCLPPPDKMKQLRESNTEFGLAGRIATQAECTAAGGRFVPQIFGWMIHIYPYEQKPEDIWSVDRAVAEKH